MLRNHKAWECVEKHISDNEFLPLHAKACKRVLYIPRLPFFRQTVFFLFVLHIQISLKSYKGASFSTCVCVCVHKSEFKKIKHSINHKNTLTLFLSRYLRVSSEYDFVLVFPNLPLGMENLSCVEIQTLGGEETSSSSKLLTQKNASRTRSIFNFNPAN